MKTLIIVDVQYDFSSPAGSMYVQGGDKVVEAIASLLESDKEIERVIFTLDWHPYNHCSFIEQGGEWPIHCVNHHVGASLPGVLLSLTSDKSVIYATKGEITNEEEYGAFSNLGDYSSFYTVNTDSWNDSETEFDEDEEIILCGIAGDYCVLETLKNLKPLWDNISLYMDGIASIDGGEKLNEFIKENDIKCLA